LWNPKGEIHILLGRMYTALDLYYR